MHTHTYTFRLVKYPTKLFIVEAAFIPKPRHYKQCMSMIMCILTSISYTFRNTREAVEAFCTH